MQAVLVQVFFNFFLVSFLFLGHTLKNGIEKMLKHYIPEVQSVEAVDNEEGVV